MNRNIFYRPPYLCCFPLKLHRSTYTDEPCYQVSQDTRPHRRKHCHTHARC